MGRLAAHLDPQGEHALRLHPDVEVGRLAGDREVADVALFDEVVGAPRLRLVGLLVRDAEEVHPHRRLAGELTHREHHAGEPALHVVGAAAVEAVAVEPGLVLALEAGDHVEVTVEDDRGAALPSHGRGDHGEAVVRPVLDFDVIRLEPALHEPGGRPDAVQGRGVVRDEPLGEGLLLHRREDIGGIGLGRHR